MGQTASKLGRRVWAASRSNNAEQPFTRGAQKQYPRETQQEQFLKSKSGPSEMPPDLLQFLQDVGPLKEKQPKQKSTRSLLQPQEVEDESRRRQSTEQRSSTNFSTRRETDTEFGLTVTELYQLLSSKSQPEFGPTTEKQQTLLQQTREALQVPVVLRDVDDDSFVGAQADRVADLKRLNLIEVPKTQVKLVLEDLVEIEKENTTQDDTLETKTEEKQAQSR